MQGTAADIIKRAMIDVDSWLTSREDIKLVMQVHDELVFEIDETVVNESTQRICQIMQDVVTLKVPLIVDAGEGENWALAH